MNSFRRSRFLAVPVLALALLGAGCGGDSDEDEKKEYADKLDDASGTFNRELTAAGAVMRQAGQAKSRDQYGEGAQQLQAAADEFKEELDELDAPEDAQDEEDDVVEAVDSFAESVGRINQAVQDENDDAIRSEAAGVQAKGAEVDQAIRELKEAVE
jgi:hypothetical protein